MSSSRILWREITKWHKASVLGLSVTVDAIAEICKKYNDDELVVKQFGLLFEWLEKQAEGVRA